MDAVTKEILMQADGQLVDICMRRGTDGTMAHGLEADAIAAIQDYLSPLIMKGMEQNGEHVKTGQNV